MTQDTVRLVVTSPETKPKTVRVAVTPQRAEPKTVRVAVTPQRAEPKTVRVAVRSRRRVAEPGTEANDSRVRGQKFLWRFRARIRKHQSRGA